MGLFEMIDLADMFRGMGELEPHALAMPAGRKAPALDHRHLVRHVGMQRIVRDFINAGLRHNLAGLELLRHSCPPRQTYRRFVKRSSTRRRSVLRRSPEQAGGEGHGVAACTLRHSWTIAMRIASFPPAAGPVIDSILPDIQTGADPYSGQSQIIWAATCLDAVPRDQL
jgi:hypothetical protein